MQPEPSPGAVMLAEGTESDPTIVRLDNETSSLVLLSACISAMCLGALVVLGFRN